MSDIKHTAELKTPWFHGTDDFKIKRFTATEGISELFEFRIEAFDEIPDGARSVGLGVEMGADVTVTINSYDGEKRYFVGSLAAARLLGSEKSTQTNYLLILRPWIYLMSKRINSRVYAELSATDILKAIIAEYDRVGEYNFQGTYPKLEYCVQHEESDLDFFLRLMESNGISYHFKFADESQTIVLTDHARDPTPGKSAKRPFIPPTSNSQRNEEYIYDWREQRQFVTSKVATTDYNFLAPTTGLIKNTEAVNDFAAKYRYEHYEHPYNLFPNKYVSAADGDMFAKAWQDSFSSQEERYLAFGDAVGLIPGFTIEFVDEVTRGSPAALMGGFVPFLVVRCSHQYQAPEYDASGAAVAEALYSGIYEVMPASKNFAPPMVTPRPHVHGVQTGTVVVLGAGEIDSDEYGRILVHLHWNRVADDQKPEGHTMRCRVVHSLAGKDWGTQYIPRKGMEVLVQFVDGDPDRPVVIGCVYNKDNMPPYTPKTDQKNITGIKSRSTIGGTADDYNEFVLDDTKGSELIRLHAQKNLDSTVELDETRQIGHDRTTTIEHDDIYTIKNDRTSTITHDETLTIKHDRITNITNNDTLDAKNEISITATAKITLTVGGSKIVIEPASITISSVEIKTTASAMATHDGGGMMIIKAGMVQIN